MRIGDLSVFSDDLLFSLNKPCGIKECPDGQGLNENTCVCEDCPNGAPVCDAKKIQVKFGERCECRCKPDLCLNEPEKTRMNLADCSCECPQPANPNCEPRKFWNKDSCGCKDCANLDPNDPNSLMVGGVSVKCEAPKEIFARDNGQCECACRPPAQPCAPGQIWDDEFCNCYSPGDVIAVRPVAAGIRPLSGVSAICVTEDQIAKNPGGYTKLEGPFNNFQNCELWSGDFCGYWNQSEICFPQSFYGLGIWSSESAVGQCYRNNTDTECEYVWSCSMRSTSSQKCNQDSYTFSFGGETPCANQSSKTVISPKRYPLLFETPIIPIDPLRTGDEAFLWYTDASGCPPTPFSKDCPGGELPFEKSFPCPSSSSSSSGGGGGSPGGEESSSSSSGLDSTPGSPNSSSSSSGEGYKSSSSSSSSGSSASTEIPASPSSSSSSSSSCPYPSVPACQCGYGVNVNPQGCIELYCLPCPSSTASGGGTGQSSTTSGGGTGPSSTTSGGSSGSSSPCGYPTIPECQCGLYVRVDGNGCIVIECEKCPSSSSSSQHELTGCEITTEDGLVIQTEYGEDLSVRCDTSSSSIGSSSSSGPSSSSSSGADDPIFDKQSWSSQVPSPFAGYLNQAADRWNSFVKFNSSVRRAIKNIYPGWNGIALDQNSYEQYNNPQSTVIASCGVTYGVDLAGNAVKFNATHFSLSINTHFQSSFSPEDWINVLTHELGHALGIGVFWDPDIVGITGGVAPENDFLSGVAYVNAQQSYNLITSLSRQKMPLEGTGGAGTQSSHWENDYRPSASPGSLGFGYYGFSNELMIGYYAPGSNAILSRLSISTLVDFGYEERNPGQSEGTPSTVSGVGAMNTEGMLKLDCGCKKRMPIIKKLADD